jgi:hypothetical protein
MASSNALSGKICDECSAPYLTGGYTCVDCGDDLCETCAVKTELSVRRGASVSSDVVAQCPTHAAENKVPQATLNQLLTDSVANIP